MISRPTASYVLTGLLAGGVFSALTDAVSGGVAVVYLPVLLLLLVGLSSGAPAAAVACIIAALVAGLLGGMDNGVAFVLLVALPGYYFTWGILRHRGEDVAVQWYPALRVIAEMTGFACLFFLICAVWAGHDGDDLHRQLGRQIADGLAVPADRQMAKAMGWLTQEGLFMLIAWAVWLWLLLLYGVAVLANALLGLRHAKLRPGIAIQPGGLPPWLAAGLVISALLALFGRPADHFTGETLFLILLLPYFLAGLSHLHKTVRKWPGGGLWLILIYGVFVLLPWLIFLLTALGLYTQLREVLDKGRKIG